MAKRKSHRLWRLGQTLLRKYALSLCGERFFIQLGQGEPSDKYRVTRLAALGQVAHPTPGHIRVELGLPREFVDLARLNTGRSMRRPNVVTGLLLHLFADTRVLFLLVIFQAFLASFALLFKRLTLNGIDRVADERLVLWLVATGKHAVQRVIVRGGHRVVFVVVAPRTTDGQPHHAAGHHVDAVVDNVVRIVQKTATQREESHRRQRPFVFAQLKPVGRQLLDQKTVNRQVVVEGVDDVIPVGVRVGEQPRLIAGEVALGVSVAGHVQPVPRPAFAKTRRGKQPIDQLAVGIGRGAVDECLNLPR